MKKAGAVLIVVICGVWVGYWMSRPQAPLEDGLYLVYDYGGSELRLTFSEMSKNKFKVTVSPGEGEKMVDRRLRSDTGVYDAEVLGPLWIPPGTVKVGGKVHGGRVGEVKRWKNWDVGVIKATFGHGAALRGEWYYEKNTGFLVGGNRTTAVSDEGEGIYYVLTESNLDQLNPR